MISFVPKGLGESIVKGMKAVLPNYSVELMETDRNGLRVEALKNIVCS